MKKWSNPKFILFILACLAMNLAGREFSAWLELPVWLDCVGTVVCAYAAGPFCGALIGLTGALLYAMAHHMIAIYAVTSVAVGIVVGLEARRKPMDSPFNALLVGGILTVIATSVSLAVNLLFYNGETGNIWGNGVIACLLGWGFPEPLADGIGQLYLEVLDKMLTMLLLCFAIRMARSWRTADQEQASGEQEQASGEKEPAEEKGDKDGHGSALCDTGTKAVSLLAAAVLGSALCAGSAGAEDAVTDYSCYVQTVYSSWNGLPCGEANDIAQTPDGILWVGTYAGLYRYNGSEFRWMNGFDSVRNVNCLYVDKEGRLWIGTNDRGLSICINDKIANVVSEDDGLPANSVRSIIQSADGYYYIGTTGNMQVLSLNSGLRKVAEFPGINYADCSAADDAGHVAAVTNDGRLFLIRGVTVISSQVLPESEGRFSCCAFDLKGRLIAGTTGKEIHVYDVSGDTFRETEIWRCPGLHTLKDLYPLENGDIFVTSDIGAGYLDASLSWHLINTNDFNASIDRVLRDYQGNFWLTSSRLGLLRMAPSSFRDIYAMTGMDKQVVNTVEKWGDTIYFGTDKGLDAVTADARKKVEDDLTAQFAGIRIRCMLTDSRNALWICTYGKGLYEILPDGSQFHYDTFPMVRIVSELSDGTILAGTDTGITCIRDHEEIWTIENDGERISSMILTFTEMADGRVLAGTNGDGIAVLQNGEILRMMNRKDGLSSGVILRTVKDPKAEAVFIVTSNGLCYMDESSAVRSLTRFPYFNNYNIFFPDEDTLFVMSSAGIYIVDRDELVEGGGELSYELLDARRGLNSALTANSWVWQDENHDLYLPCDNGVFVINTDKYSSGVMSCRITMRTMKLDNRAISVERDMNIVVDRDVTRIELLPEVINYTILDPPVGYWLEGFDSGWTIAPRSSLTSVAYTNLKPGNYIFHLAVFDNAQQSILAQRAWKMTKEEAIYDRQGFKVYLAAIPMMTLIWAVWSLGYSRYRRGQKELALARRQIDMANETIVTIANTVDAKDARTSDHSKRVAEYSAMIAEKIGMTDEEISQVYNAARLHDIGKIAIPDRILNKPDRLTDEEYAEMKSHTVRGAEILNGFTLVKHVADGALYHHERYDGRGYPNGLKGEAIPLYGRIIGVADAFDAMTATRVYRHQMDFDYVLGEIRRGRGTQFDPQMADTLLELISEGKIDIRKVYHVSADGDGEKPPEDRTAEGKPPEAGGTNPGKPGDDRKPEVGA